MLVVFPIGLWIFSLICDLIYHAGAHNAFALFLFNLVSGITPPPKANRSECFYRLWEL
jgi:uncharacterized membrane protein